MLINDPIFALATSIQTSALHLHRISGNGVFEVLLPYLKQKNAYTLPLNCQFPFTKYLKIYDKNNTIIDDSIITFYKNPQSYTGEDLIEICSHGNPLISKNIQSLLRSLGLRDAKEGEFTQRAFLNGKLDLAQADAILELIRAETQIGLKLARNQINGTLRYEIESLKTKFVEILAYLEAHIDFDQDEIGTYCTKSLIPKLQDIIDRLIFLKSTYQSGLKLRSGLKVVLCGKPNSGKSTLYNKLLKYERAIVTEIPGTTRDILSEHFQIENRDFTLIDTAGLRKTKNKIEHLGIQKSIENIKNSDILCVLLDGKKFNQSILAVKEYLRESLESNNSSNVIFVISKSDLLTEKKQKSLLNEFKKHFFYECVFVSKENISSLTHILKERYDSYINSTLDFSKNAPVLLSTRSVDKVQASLEILNEIKRQLMISDLPEKIASNLYVSLKTLEEILGEFDMDSVYESIFSKFCIGK